MNETNNIEYEQIKSPDVAYIYETNAEIIPLYSSSDGYGTVHAWSENGGIKAGVEIERRYLSSGDKLYPKIKVYDVIPQCVIDELNNLWKNYKKD